MVLEPARNDMDDIAVRIALNDAVYGHQAGAHDDLALFLEHVGPDDEIGDAGLVFDGDEDDALGAAGRWRISTRPAIERRFPSFNEVSRSAAMNFCSA